MNTEMIRPRQTPSVMFDAALADKQLNELSMLRSEVEMLVDEDVQLMKIAGAAALFVSELQGAALPQSALDAASTLAKLICEIPDDTMCAALDMLNH